MDDLQIIHKYDSILDMIYYPNFKTEYTTKVEIVPTEFDSA